METGRRFDHLDALRGLSIVLVVGVHAHGYADPGGLGLSPRVDALWPTVSSIAVASFFLVDGYLFARTTERPGPFDYLAYLRRSAQRLLLPWLIFSLLYTGLRGAFEAAGFFPVRLVIGRSAAEVARSLYDSQIAMQMYFLAALFVIRSASFLTRHLSRAPGPVVLAVWLLYTGLLAATGFRHGDDPFTSAVVGFRYYLLGMAVWKFDGLIRASRHWLWPVLLLAAVVARSSHLNLGPTTQYLAILAAYTFFLAVTRGENLLVALGRQTMGIYLLHAPVVMKVAQVVSSRVVRGRLAMFLAIWALSFLGALVLNWVVLRVPRGRVLFGEFGGGPTRITEPPPAAEVRQVPS